MHIKARVTTVAVQNNPTLFDIDSDLLAAEALFDTDPLISHDRDGWFLSASEIDAEDLNESGGDIWSTAAETLRSINGIAGLLRHGLRINPIILTGQIEGRRSPIRAYDLITRVRAASFTVDGLDSKSAETLSAIVLSDPIVARVADLLTRFELETFWFDSYKAFEVMANCSGGEPAFARWLESTDARLAELLKKYLREANKSNGDAHRRHDVKSTRGRGRERLSIYLSNRPTRPDQELIAEYSDGLRSIAVLWINHDFATGIQRHY